MKTEYPGSLHIKMLAKFTSTLFFSISITYLFLNHHKRFALNKIPLEEKLNVSIHRLGERNDLLRSYWSKKFNNYDQLRMFDTFLSL